MKKQLTVIVFLIALLLVALAGSGCASAPYKLKCKPIANYPARRPMNLNVALVLQNEFTGGVVYKRPRILLNPPQSFTAPGSLEHSAEALARALFSHVQVVKGPSPTIPQNCDLVIKPHVTSVQESWELKGGIILFLEWTVTRPDGQLVWEQTVKGESTGSAWLGPLFHRAIDEAFHHSYEEMSASPEIRAVAEDRHQMHPSGLKAEP